MWRSLVRLAGERGSSVRFNLSGWAMGVALLATAPAMAQPVDLGAVNRIMDAGIARSEVMELAATLSDRLGGRLSNSPQARATERWTEAKLREWGLKNVHAEGFEFGRGWSIERSSVRMVTPRPLDLRAMPVAWTPPSQGTVRAELVLAPMTKDADLAQWRGKLRGKIVLISNPADPLVTTQRGTLHRFTDEELRALEGYEYPKVDEVDLGAWFADYQAFNRRLDAFLAEEGALGWARMAKRAGQLVGEGYFHRRGETPKLFGMEIAAVDYRRLARLAKGAEPVTLDVLSDVRFHDEDSRAYNIFGEIPGRDPKAGYVMAGSHLDAWVAGDGAADAGGNVAVIMEAARILSSLGIVPKRTIRFAFWGGEQQGLFGIQDYVERNLAARGRADDPDIHRRDYGRWEKQFPIVPKPGYRDMAAYFTLDNGPGRIRGIYAEGNAELVPVFRQWLAPFAGLGASTVSMRGRIESGHQYMQDIGLPGFQFIQDPIDSDHQVFQTGLDSLDVLNADDLRQNAVIMASFLLFAANADQPLARKPIPVGPAMSR